MTLTVWRLQSKQYYSPQAAFAGEGAYRFGGRWNPPGVRVVYTSSSLALAVLERLVHTESVRGLRALVAYSYTLHTDEIMYLEQAQLPKHWDAKYAATSWKKPPTKPTQKIGQIWFLQTSSLALRVPSAVLPQEFNCLLNPTHPDFDPSRVKRLEDFAADKRIVELFKER